jgi:hypothetical protein
MLKFSLRECEHGKRDLSARQTRFVRYEVALARLGCNPTHTHTPPPPPPPPPSPRDPPSLPSTLSYMHDVANISDQSARTILSRRCPPNEIESGQSLWREGNNPAVRQSHRVLVCRSASNLLYESCVKRIHAHRGFNCVNQLESTSGPNSVAHAKENVHAHAVHLLVRDELSAFLTCSRSC